MHARFATHANKDKVDCAHPFAIKRDNEVKLWGCHNGVVSGAWASSSRHGRNFTVDSREVFELMADNLHHEILEMNGYGTLAWINDDDRHAIRLVMASSSAALWAAKTTCDAVVFGSTESIVREALAISNLEIKYHYDLKEGVTYVARANELWESTSSKPLTFKQHQVGYTGYRAKSWKKNDDGTWSYSYDNKHWYVEHHEDYRKQAWREEDWSDDGWDWQNSHYHTQKNEAPPGAIQKYEPPINKRILAKNDEESEPQIAVTEACDNLDPSDWWRTAESGDQFDEAAFLRWLAEHEKV
jgi:hypothetical protein